MKNCNTTSAVPASPSRSPLTPALRQRLKGLIDMGSKGLLHDSPDVLGALYHCCAWCSTATMPRPRQTWPAGTTPKRPTEQHHTGQPL